MSVFCESFFFSNFNMLVKKIASVLRDSCRNIHLVLIIICMANNTLKRNVLRQIKKKYFFNGCAVFTSKYIRTLVSTLATSSAIA